MKEWTYDPQLISSALSKCAEATTPTETREQYNTLTPEEQDQINEMAHQIRGFFGKSGIRWKVYTAADASIDAYLRIIDLVRKGKARFEKFGGFVSAVCKNIVHEARRKNIPIEEKRVSQEDDTECLSADGTSDAEEYMEDAGKRLEEGEAMHGSYKHGLHESPEIEDIADAAILKPRKTRYAKRTTAKWEDTLTDEQVALLVFRNSHLLNCTKPYVQQIAAISETAKKTVEALYKAGQIKDPLFKGSPNLTLELGDLDITDLKVIAQAILDIGDAHEGTSEDSSEGTHVHQATGISFTHTKSGLTLFDLIGVESGKWFELKPLEVPGFYEKYGWPQCQGAMIEAIQKLKPAQRKMLIRLVVKQHCLSDSEFFSLISGGCPIERKRYKGEMGNLIGLRDKNEPFRRKRRKATADPKT